MRDPGERQAGTGRARQFTLRPPMAMHITAERTITCQAWMAAAVPSYSSAIGMPIPAGPRGGRRHRCTGWSGPASPSRRASFSRRTSLWSGRQRYTILTLMTETSFKAHLGQAQDIYWSGNISRENLDRWLENSLDAQILQMYSYKTASATEGVAALSAIFWTLPTRRKRPASRSAGRWASSFRSSTTC